MWICRGRFWRVLVVLSLWLSAPEWAVADVAYTVIDLGVLVTGGTSTGNAINQSGVVVGGGLNGFLATTAAVTGEGGKLVSLGTLPGGRSSQATAINDGGQIVGYSQVSTSTGGIAIHAFVGSAPNVLQDLGVNPGWASSYATGINNSNRIVGYLQSGSIARAFYQDGTGSMIEMGTLGGLSSQASGVNAGGDVVGWSSIDGTKTHAFIAVGGGSLRDLGALPGGDGNSYANAVNDAGKVVGTSGAIGGVSRAFITTLGGTMQSLGSLDGAGSSTAYAINNHDVVVGSSFTSSGASRAFIYTDKLIDLNTLITPASGWILNSASGINDSGMITGTGLFQGQTRAFLLIAVPEPSLPWLIGVAALMGMGRAAGARLRLGRTGALAGGGLAAAFPVR